MATVVTYNGVSYSIPGTGESNWGGTNEVDGLLIALAQNTLSTGGGLFALTADLDLGPSAGIVATYFKSRSSNLPVTGVLRLANGDIIAFRNQANSGDLALSVNSSNQLTFNGSGLITGTSTTTLQNKLLGDASDATKTFGVSTSGSTTGKGVTLSFAATNNRTYTFQDSSDTMVGRATTDTLQNKLLGDASDATKTFAVSTSGSTTAKGATLSFAVTNNRTYTFQDSSDTMVGRATTDTLTNKTISAASNTLTLRPSDVVPTRNFLLNSGFDFWQRGTSVAVTSQANPATPTYLYEADRWYVNNILGGGTVQGIITFSQVTGVTNGSKFGAKVQITTAPTGTNKQNGCELYQTLENLDSIILYGQTASFSVLVKAFGNVNQVGVQFFYKTTEAKVDTAIGSEVLTTVNSSTFTACTISGQALGTTQTTSGVIGVRIRITGVSTLNLYDVNNGFVVEQAQLNVGSTVASWQRAGASIAEEKRLCQRFYQVAGAGAVGRFYTTTDIAIGGQFPVEPRAPSGLSISSIGTATVTEVGVGNKTSSSTPSLSTTASSGYYMTLAGFTGATSGNTAVGITDFMIVACEI